MSGEVHLPSISSTNKVDDDEDKENELQSSVDIRTLVQVMALVDSGQFFSKRRGKSGLTPAQDLLPFFKSQNRYFYLLWHDRDPNLWRLVYTIENMNSDSYSNGKSYDSYMSFSNRIVKSTLENEKSNRIIFLNEITDVLLDVVPSAKFRLYINSGDVIELTPIPAKRELAVIWVNAIYSGFQLQSENIDIVSQARRDLFFDEISSRKSFKIVSNNNDDNINVHRNLSVDRTEDPDVGQKPKPNDSYDRGQRPQQGDTENRSQGHSVQRNSLSIDDSTPSNSNSSGIFSAGKRLFRRAILSGSPVPRNNPAGRRGSIDDSVITYKDSYVLESKRRKSPIPDNDDDFRDQPELQAKDETPQDEISNIDTLRPDFGADNNPLDLQDLIPPRRRRKSDPGLFLQASSHEATKVHQNGVFNNNKLTVVDSLLASNPGPSYKNIIESASENMSRISPSILSDLPGYEAYMKWKDSPSNAAGQKAKEELDHGAIRAGARNSVGPNANVTSINTISNTSQISPNYTSNGTSGRSQNVKKGKSLLSTLFRDVSEADFSSNQSADFNATVLPDQTGVKRFSTSEMDLNGRLAQQTHGRGSVIRKSMFSSSRPFEEDSEVSQQKSLIPFSDLPRPEPTIANSNISSSQPGFSLLARMGSVTVMCILTHTENNYDQLIVKQTASQRITAFDLQDIVRAECDQSNSGLFRLMVKLASTTTHTNPSSSHHTNHSGNDATAWMIFKAIQPPDPSLWLDELCLRRGIPINPDVKNTVVVPRQRTHQHQRVDKAVVAKSSVAYPVNSVEMSMKLRQQDQVLHQKQSGMKSSVNSVVRSKNSLSFNPSNRRNTLN